MGGKSKSSNTQTTELNSWSKQQYNDLAGKTVGLLGGSFQPHTGDLSAGLSGLEQQAGQAGQSAVGQGQGLLGQASAMAGAAGGYRPQNVSASSVNAGQLAGMDLSAYMNPHQDAVIDAAMGDIDRSRQMAVNNQSGEFTKARAWGGSRHGIADAETNRAFGDIAARTASGLRSEGFQNAQAAAQNDLARRYSADTFNSGQGLQAQGMNQSAGLQGAQLGLSAAGLLGNLGQAQHGMAWGDAQGLLGLGQNERGVEQSALDRQYAEAMRGYEDQFRRAQGYMGLLGATPMLTNSKGMSTQGQSADWAKIAGTAAQVGATMFSDRRLKENVVEVETDANGRRWYDFTYRDDPEGRVHRGVMAQDLLAEDPHHPAVSTDERGFYLVNYGAL